MHRFVLVEFPFIDEPENTKLRPALMLSKPTGKHKTVVLAYVTTKKDEVLDVDVILSRGDKGFLETGLMHDSVIKFYKLTSVEAASIQGELGALSKALEAEVSKKLKIVFGL